MSQIWLIIPLLTYWFHCENADHPWRPPPGSAASGYLGSDPAATYQSFHRENADHPSPLPPEKAAGCGNDHLFDLPYSSLCQSSAPGTQDWTLCVSDTVASANGCLTRRDDHAHFTSVISWLPFSFVSLFPEASSLCLIAPTLLRQLRVSRAWSCSLRNSAFAPRF